MTTEKQYRELGDDEVLREGDQYRDAREWHNCRCIGMTVHRARHPFHRVKYRRPIEANETKGSACND